MHKRAPTGKPHHDTRGHAKDFPGPKLINLLYTAKNPNGHHGNYLRIILDFTKELWHHFDDTLLEMAHFSDGKEIAIIEEGDEPNADFAIKMLHRLRIVGHDDEKEILKLMGSELMAWMVYSLKKPYPVGDTHELAYDHDGDTLVLRLKTAGQERAAA